MSQQNKNIKQILLVDDRLGFLGTAKFFQYMLNEKLKGQRNGNSGNSKFAVKVIPEKDIKKLETRIKTKPFDLILLDLVFGEKMSRTVGWGMVLGVRHATHREISV